MKIKDTNWGWDNGRRVYFKLTSNTCVSLLYSEYHSSNLEYGRVPTKYFTLPKEFVINDNTN